MKIYTKGGDKGKTSLIGGSRVPKFHDKVEAYGTIDELCSYIGLIRDISEDDSLRKLLLQIQDRLFLAESKVATDSIETMKKMPDLQEADIELLEKEIDSMNEQLPQLTKFILPGGHILASHTHIARSICRRAERLTIKAFPEQSDFLSLKYLNRLSDFLFVLARKFANELGEGDVIWEGKSGE